MRFSKTGVTFKYHGDQLTWRWPWSRNGMERYYSTIYTQDFNSLSEYWKHVGVVEEALVKSSGKLEAYSELEVLSVWVRRLYPTSHVVVLTNLDASAKGISFWSRLPKDQVEHLLKDVIVLRCKDKTEVFRLVDSVEATFADAFGFSFGQLIETNIPTPSDYLEV